MDEVTHWRDLTGYYTRFGEVTPLLHASDDRYVIFNAGDQLTLSFDATTLPPLPAGWQRDFIFYSNGWVKDGDINTAHSQTVEPLPFHAMSGYPYGPDEHYPSDPEQVKYLETYNTRHVGGERFRDAVRLRW